MDDKALVWLHGEIKTPPFSSLARTEAGYYLRLLQQGAMLSLPHSRPMPVLGARCHELRVRAADKNWRILYRVDSDAILILDVFEKTTQATPKAVLDRCKRRLSLYDSASLDEGN